MIDRVVAIILDESKWLTTSMTLASLAVVMLLYRYRQSVPSVRVRVLAAMNLFFGVTIGTMAFGHLLAVTIKFAAGTLEGSIHFLYAIGIALAVPSWWLIGHTQRMLALNRPGRSTIILNVWLALTLVVLGLPNLPLAVPAFLNVGYQLHSRPIVGRAILAIAVIFSLGLFIGSLIFFASGQTFEEFRGGK